MIGDQSQLKQRMIAGLFGVVLLSLAGCGGIDGVELQGGVFDALGVSGTNKGKAAEASVARRNRLVLPPDAKALPVPGSGAVAQAGSPNWPVDPNKAKVVNASAQAAIVQKYCGDQDWWERYNPREFNEMTNGGNLCKSGLSKLFNKGIAGARPDASDRSSAPPSGL